MYKHSGWVHLGGAIPQGSSIGVSVLHRMLIRYLERRRKIQRYAALSSDERAEHIIARFMGLASEWPRRRA